MEIAKKVPDKQRVAKGIVYKNIRFSEAIEDKMRKKNYALTMFR